MGKSTIIYTNDAIQGYCFSFSSVEGKRFLPPSPPNLIEVVFIISQCSTRFIQTQGHSAVDVPYTKDAADKTSLCTSVSSRSHQRWPGEGARSDRPSLAATLHVVLLHCVVASFCPALKFTHTLCECGVSNTRSL